MSGRGNRTTAQAWIATRVRRVVEPDGRAVEVETAVEYVYGQRRNSLGELARSTRSGGNVRFYLTPGDIVGLAAGWEEIFELAAGVVQNQPLSIRWRIELTGLNGSDEWVRGAIETLVRVAAYELRIKVL